MPTRHALSALVPSPRRPLDDHPWDAEPRPLREADAGAVPEAAADADAGFVGRHRERAVLAKSLEDVRSGRAQMIMVDGPAGIGKTALIERFLDGLSDPLVLRANGEPWEALVEFGVAGQLVRGTGSSVARLLALAGSGLPCDEPNRVGVQFLGLLAELEAQGPVVVLVDDVQWADVGSMRALLFALRRLSTERVLAVLAGRQEEAARLPDGLVRLASGRTGTTLHLGPLTPYDVQAIASGAAGRVVPARVGSRLHAHTRGNPAHVRALLAELPTERWCTLDGALPAPRDVVRSVRNQLSACSPQTQRLVEAAAVLGDGTRLSTAAALAGVGDPLNLLDEACSLGLLDAPDEPGRRDVEFPHPLVRAAVHEQLGPARRVGLHLGAAALVDDVGEALRHRVVAADPPDDRLADELSAFAEQQARSGASARAASALTDASRLSSRVHDRGRRLLRAVDILATAGDLARATTFTAEVCDLAPGALRDVVLSNVAILGGRPNDAEALLLSAWRQCDRSANRQLAAAVACRRAVHSAARLSASAVVDWAERASVLAGSDRRLGAEAAAMLGTGLGWAGRLADGLAVQDAFLAESADAGGPAEIKSARGALRLAADDLVGARAELTEATLANERAGAFSHAVWAYAWLSRAEFLAGSWDAAAMAADRAVSLLEETGHEWLRPLARWAAVGVPAARGEWGVASEHARLAGAQSGDYELMVVAGGLARAQVAAARGDAEGVLRALEPVVAVRPRDGVDEPGFWPWQGLYGDALVSLGRLEQAEAFLVPHEELARVRARPLSVAALAGVRGRLEAVAGRVDAAEAAFRRGLAALGTLPVPFPRGLLELGFGQVLRRHGHRRAAAEQLGAARDRFVGLGAQPYAERCEQELSACGLAPAKRREFDPSRLTAQELAVARLVAAGMSNRQVASELFISVKTVQFHLTRIYSKLRIGCRVELVANSEWFAEVEGERASTERRRGRSGAAPEPTVGTEVEGERASTERRRGRSGAAPEPTVGTEVEGERASTERRRGRSGAIPEPTVGTEVEGERASTERRRGRSGAIPDPTIRTAPARAKQS